MATTQKKSATTAKRRQGNGGSRAAPRGSASGTRTKRTTVRTTKTVQKQQPVRREVTGIVFLLAALCVLVSYFTSDGWLIARIPNVLKGMFGPGFYLVVPVLLCAAWVQINHNCRPVALRTACILLVPYLFGGVWHILFCKADLKEASKLFATLLETGLATKSGGLLSGATAHGFINVLGKPASALVFIVLILVLLMVTFEVTPSMLYQVWQEREPYDDEDYEDDPDDYVVPKERPRPKPAAAKPTPKPAPKPRHVRTTPQRQKASAKARPSIDIPLDYDDEDEQEPDHSWTSGSSGDGFYKPPEKERMTPAGWIEQNGEDEPAPEQAEPVSGGIPEAEESEEEVIEPTAIPNPEPQPLQPEPAEPQEKNDSEEIEMKYEDFAAEIEIQETAGDTYEFPPINLLNQNQQNNYIEAGAELRLNAQRLADTLHSFGVYAEPGDVVRGPAITRYEFTLGQGVKLNKVTNLSDDIALALGASGVRTAPILDKISVVGIEVPNKTVSPVLIRDVVESGAFKGHRSAVAFAVGRDIGNKDIVGDISSLPHVLIAGTTGSGKSVCTNSLIISLLYKSSPEDVRFIMVDPKMVELAPYNGIPHLLIPVVTDPKKAAGALQWAVYEMMKRYKTFSEIGVKKLEEYNAAAAAGRTGPNGEELPHMASVVVVIDELADLMLVAAKEVEESICRVAQMGRAAGMHLVIATQRPSSDVITGLMKANIPSRIAFAVASSLESRIILDAAGAEKLVGRGDMLYAPLGSGKPVRVQGCFITPEEIDRVVKHVKSTGEAQYSDEVMQKIEESIQEKDGKKGGNTAAAVPEEESGSDELLPAAVEVILETGQASVSMLQRRLKLGYSRAARLVDQMEERGYVGPFEGSKPRQLLITRAKWQEIQMGGSSAPDPVDEDTGGEF
ncbi:MAG: DNA translocase FtsK [Oscillospiraceae bacterium]|nr:DNA translocase FtsK [Oscillospiraceae bacterium]